MKYDFESSTLNTCTNYYYIYKRRLHYEYGFTNSVNSIWAVDQLLRPSRPGDSELHKIPWESAHRISKLPRKCPCIQNVRGRELLTNHLFEQTTEMSFEAQPSVVSFFPKHIFEIHIPPELWMSLGVHDIFCRQCISSRSSQECICMTIFISRHWTATDLGAETCSTPSFISIDVIRAYLRPGI